MTALSIKALCALTAQITGDEVKRAATAEAAVKRLRSALTERVGAELAEATLPDLLITGDLHRAALMVAAAIRQHEDNLLAAIEAPVEAAPAEEAPAAILPAPRFAGPGLARLRAAPNAEAIRLEVVANNEAAERGEDPFKPQSKVFRKAALELVEQAAPAPAAKPAKVKKEKAPKVKAEKAGRAPRVKTAPEGKIIAVVANPKKAGSRAHACFEVYKAGQSIADFIAACGAAGIPESEAKANLSWDRRKGFITVEG